MQRRKFLAMSSITSLWLLSGCESGIATGSNSANAGSSGDMIAGRKGMGGGNGGRMNGGRMGGGNNGGGTGGGNTGTPATSTLPIPELRRPVLRDGVQHYDLDVVEAEHAFFKGAKTKTYAIEGSYLGPTLLLSNGDDVSLNYTNKLPVETTMHGHGMHVPGEMDGTAHQPIAVGSTWSAKYTVDQRACMNWYHPHYMHKTAPHVYQGLAGCIIIEDDESRALDVPQRYGIDDIPLVLQDRFFSADKTALVYAPSNMQLNMGYVGDTFIANGAIEPTFEAEAKELRIRLLNGSNSTMYTLGFTNGKVFKQIATDNAFLEKPVSMSKIVLSPGERAEIVVDLTDDMGSALVLQEFNYTKTFLTVNVSKEATAVTTTPRRLTTLEPIETPVRKRVFKLGMKGMGQFTINGKSMDMMRIDERLNLGDVEEWEIINNMGMNHNFHIHATHFRVISRNGSAAKVRANEKGYKDVVHLAGKERVKFIVKMTDVTADDANPYMFHCHFLEHEDNGMMGQFTVS